MRSNRLLFLSGTLGCTGVILGAFGAHALKERLTSAGMVTTWDKAVLYQLFHTLAILAVGLAAAGFDPINKRWLSRAGISWSIGVLLFSGSLYGLALGGPRWLGPITPLGGLAMIAGWTFLVIASCKINRSGANVG